jgi:hypothetical protein
VIELIGRDGAGQVVVRTEQCAFPGSPDSPPTDAQIAEKVRDCLAHYEQGCGTAVSYDLFEAEIDALFAPPMRGRKAAARPTRHRAAGD